MVQPILPIIFGLESENHVCVPYIHYTLRNVFGSSLENNLQGIRLNA